VTERNRLVLDHLNPIGDDLAARRSRRSKSHPVREANSSPTMAPAITLRVQSGLDTMCLIAA
jgi:hypothetical protein